MKLVFLYPRYITSNNNAPLAPGAVQTYSINSIQLDKIPDKFIVFARVPLAQQTVRSADAFLPIERVNVTFANASGLLSNHTQQQLWEMSRKNGAKQSWYSWSGVSSQYSAAVGAPVARSTCGPILVIDPAYDLSLQGPYLSDGSLGQFQVQMALTFRSNFPANVNPEIVVITANSGILTTVAGNSSLYTGLLNMQQVMQTIQQDGGSAKGDCELQRLVGGSLSDDVSAALSHTSSKKKRGGAVPSGGARSGGMTSRLDSLTM